MISRRSSSVERRIEARRRLVAMARRASIVLELDPHTWASGVRRSAPELVAEIGDTEFRHLVRWAWSLP